MDNPEKLPTNTNPPMPEKTINNSKKYELKLEDIIYSLEVQLYLEDKLSFKLTKSDNLSLCYYYKEFNYNDILTLLPLNKEQYDDLSRIFSFFDKVITNKELNLVFNQNDKEMILKLKSILDSKEFESEIKLDEIKLSSEEMFKILLDREKIKDEIINNLTKKNKENEEKIKQLETQIEEYKTKLNEKTNPVKNNIPLNNQEKPKEIKKNDNINNLVKPTDIKKDQQKKEKENLTKSFMPKNIIKEKPKKENLIEYFFPKEITKEEPKKEDIFKTSFSNDVKKEEPKSEESKKDEVKEQKPEMKRFQTDLLKPTKTLSDNTEERKAKLQSRLLKARQMAKKKEEPKPRQSEQIKLKASMFERKILNMDEDH